MRYNSKVYLAGIAALALSSCADDRDGVPAYDSDTICFGGNAVSWWADDDSPRSRAGEQPPGDMGCYAFMNSETESRLLISGMEFTRNATTGIYSSLTPVYWPGAHVTIDFYNYAPYDVAGLTFDTDAREFVYTIPDDAADRCDLLLASATGVRGDLNGAKDLTFKHALTAVNFDIAKNMGSVTFKEIKFTGVSCGGKVTFDADGNVQWAHGDAADEFIFAIGETNYLIPQTLDGATMTITMNRDGQDINVTAPLKTAAIPEWIAGKSITYRLNIVPEITIEPIEPLDAHYELCPVTVHIDKLAKDRQWTVTATTSDGAAEKVTVQEADKVNTFVKQGYWTDKYMNNGTLTNESARGDESLTLSGNGDFNLMLFVPENAGAADRTISLNITLADEENANPDPFITQTITQYCPDWDNGGWERIDDSPLGIYGFFYSTKHVYVYHESAASEWGLNNPINATKKLISAYGAEAYTRVKTYDFKKYTVQALGWTTTNYRFFCEVDYSKLNTLGAESQSTTDGLGNTKYLFGYGGSGVTRTFETALEAMLRVGDSSNLAFRHRTEEKGDKNKPDDYVSPVKDPYPEVPEEEEGHNITGKNQALAVVLKKNRYNINRINDSQLGVTTAPKLLASDLVWYMPAVNQFSTFGPWKKGTVQKDQIWSSTALDDAQNALSGSNATRSRLDELHVRACRTR